MAKPPTVWVVYVKTSDPRFDEQVAAAVGQSDTGDVVTHVHDVHGDFFTKAIEVADNAPAGNANFDELVRWLDARTRERLARSRDIGRNAMYEDAKRISGR